MSRFVVIFSVLLLLISPVWSVAADTGNLEEIRQYFDLRDTISLVNLEMKRAMAPESKLSLLVEGRSENDLAEVLNFLEERILQFAEAETPLKYHYVKKLDIMFRETRQLQAALVVKMRAVALAAVPGSTITKASPVGTASEELKAHPRPYFHPIDLRTLLSPALQKSQGFKFSNASASAGVPVAKTPEEKKSIRTLPPIQSPLSPFPATMPQKTPILVEPVEIVAPPTETQAVEPLGKASEKPVATSQPTVFVAPVIASVSTKLAVDSLPLPANLAAASEAASLPATASAAVVPPIAVVATTTVEAVPAIATASTIMRPLAVMIENHNRSRPQSGLDQADLVYEMPVEGGITRFMAVYTRSPGLLGPVRSCREYFIDRALEANALYVHCGSSPTGYAYLSKSGINSVDEIKHSKPFFRDNTRKAPHNLYGTGAGLLDYMSEKIAMTLPVSPKLLNYGSNSITATRPGESVRIRYHGNYTLDVKYENGAYQRYMNDVLHVDRETQKPLRASAVVVQVAAMQVVDKAGRQEISFIGSGEAWILENGKMTAVTWAKKTPRELTSYKDSSGREYLFPKGLPVWVQVVSPALKLFFNGVEKITPVAGKDGDAPASASVSIGKQG
ncbi:MAG: DUF3048 domain-containing protein [Candidatus Riflebacteria bacterium]|nr:DUF3048 domain-containing protein [Candidatus Riflebacteria bacterium]